MAGGGFARRVRLDKKLEADTEEISEKIDQEVADRLICE